uniref:Uncharacterized protein n=1 Tax=Sphenodon punctatus TaxID=8508 RepID=A0A8D0HQZ6_SPHPU
LVLPAVGYQAASQLLNYLQETIDWNLINTDGSDISDLKLDTTKPNLFVVKLQPVNRLNEASTAKAFIENDKIIGRLTMVLQEQGIHFSAIYTALRPSRIPTRIDVALQPRRQLMSIEAQDNVLDPPLNVTNGTETCILIYANNVTLTAN